MDADVVERFLHLREEEKHTGDSWGFEGKCRPLLLLFLPNSHLPSEALCVRQEKGAGIGCVLPGLTASPGNQHTDTPSPQLPPRLEGR